MYHILSTLIKFPPPKDLRSDSRSASRSISFLGFIIPDKMELNFFFFFFFLIVFLALKGASFCDLRAGTTRVDDDDDDDDKVSTVSTTGSGRFLVIVVVVVLVLLFGVAGSCGETGVFAGGTALVQIAVLVGLVASDGRGGAFGGGAASAESMVIIVLCMYEIKAVEFLM